MKSSMARIGGIQTPCPMTRIGSDNAADFLQLGREESALSRSRLLFDYIAVIDYNDSDYPQEPS
jgi:hypothetical protein